MCYLLNAFPPQPPCLQTLLMEQLQSSDRDTTYEALEEAVAQESYLSWLREQEQRTRLGRQGMEVRGGQREGGGAGGGGDEGVK